MMLARDTFAPGRITHHLGQGGELRLEPVRGQGDINQAQDLGPLLRGRVVNGDALYCQKTLCHQLRQASADYLVAAKCNQPELLEEVALRFRDPPSGERFLTACTVSKLGGQQEQRHLCASAVLSAYLQEAGWADVHLVLAVETWVRWPAHPLRAPRYDMRYVLSSRPSPTPPTALLRFVRTHWHLENWLHWPRDVTLGEDACQIRSGRAPPGAGPRCAMR
jgi:predicted transposase YbfD/YdcC